MNRRRFIAIAAALASMAGCRGTAPVYYGESNVGFAAVLIRGRVLLPNGESRDVKMALNLEAGDEKYRLRFGSDRTTLARIEPGIYRLSPTRDIFGLTQSKLTIRINGRTWRVPFPREILRHEEIEVKPTKVVALGVLEGRLIPGDRGRKAELKVRLDDSIEARRQLVEDLVQGMMDPKASAELRDCAVSWTRALDQALNQILHETGRAPTYKPSGP